MDLPSPAQPLTPETRFLYGLQRGKTVLGLESTRRLLRALGSPEKDIPVVHVAGTNGKGTTTAFAASLLQAAGYKVGRFTSPHLLRVEERICVDDEPVGAEDFAASVRELRPWIEASGASFFETMTALASWHFRAARVDIAIYEVGLGGRLDATNVMPSAVSVLTGIGHDHEAILGRGLRAVCAEKLGIAKPGVPFHAALERPELQRQAAEHCRNQGSPLHLLPRGCFKVLHVDLWQRMRFELGEWPESPLRSCFVGAHSARSAALALRAVQEFLRRFDASRSVPVREGLAQAFLPGRFQALQDPMAGPPVVLDVSHNPQALRGTFSLARGLPELASPVIVLGMMRDKRLDGCLPLLHDWAERLILTAPRVERAWEPVEAAGGLLPKAGGLPIDVVADVGAALERARALGRPTLVIGSHYLVAEVLPLLARQWGTDPGRLLERTPPQSARAVRA